MTYRVIIAFILALTLGLTGQSMANARGAAAATGQMILCTGAGPVAVYIDAQGQPTSAPHICPDAALNVVFETPPLGMLFGQQSVQRIAWHVTARSVHIAPLNIGAYPRGPPLI